MPGNRAFPPTLLQQDIATRLRYFEGIYLAHPHFVGTRDTLLQMLQQPERPPVVCVIGASGVGKSTLIPILEKQLLQQALPDMLAHPGSIPVACAVVEPPAEASKFNWAEHDYRILKALREPLIDFKLDDDELIEFKESRKRKQVPANALYHAFRRCCQARNTAVIVLDEAQHVTKVRPEKLSEQARAIYTRARESGTTHVLFGTYELVELAHLLGTLDERNKLLQFRRYRYNDLNERELFENILFSFQQHLPLPEETDLIQDVRYFYRGCGGCVGLLKDWLTASLDAALEKGAARLYHEYLDTYMMAGHKVTQILEEATQGEETLLRLQRGEPEATQEPEKKPRPKPGRRKPTNDPTHRHREFERSQQHG